MSPWQRLRDTPRLTLAFTRLPPHEAGRYYNAEQVILLDPTLGRVERRCALAHELRHAQTADGPPAGLDAQRLMSRQEACADRGAAEWLISLDALADAMMTYAWPEDIAEHLDVTVRMVYVRCAALNPAEKDYIDSRIAAKEGAA